MMDRTELEALDRDALIARAEESGVSRARILTRPELIDELLLRSAPRSDSQTVRARGFFGRARDLLARVVELGLNLPDAAERIRSLNIVPPPPPRKTTTTVPTVTLAEIYAAQGHRDRAIETLRRVLEQEPEHAAARALLKQLEDAAYAVPAPPLPPEPEDEQTAAAPAGSRSDDDADAGANGGSAQGLREPFGMLDDEPLPPRYDVDECVAIPVDPTTLFVYWEVREDTVAFLRIAHPRGSLALRVLVIVPTWEGPRVSKREHDVGASLGDWFVRDLPPGSVVRAAIGWRVGDAFLSTAHSPALETPPNAPSPVLADALVRWTPRGLLPIVASDADAAGIERAFKRVRGHAGPYKGEEGPPDASKRWGYP